MIYIALLRGINVGGHHKMPMAELRALCDELGWNNVKSYIQSGNLIFDSAKKAPSLEKELEAAIKTTFAFEIPVVVRSAKMWDSYLSSNPYPKASKNQPNLVAMGLSKRLPRSGVVEVLRSRAANNERVTLVGKALWLHYPEGSARSKLSPAVIDKAVGSPMTLRNWRTVQKISSLTSDLS